jgi:hypothetical protein
VISDLKRCRVEGVFGALAWFKAICKHNA